MKNARRFSVLAIFLMLTGCANVRKAQDPLEDFNRAMFGFNDKVDQVAVKPAAQLYQAALPTFAQTGVNNFFGNIGDVWTAVNSLLQGKVSNGLSDVMRVMLNSTMGFAGLLDIGSDLGIPKHNEDFGQTLGVWGVKSGPYVVLPLFGPSTLRDTVAMPLDLKGDLWGSVYPVRVRNVGTVVRLVDYRSGLLDASNLMEEAALDRYEFVRDAYLQRRESKINDGETPKSKP